MGAHKSKETPGMQRQSNKKAAKNEIDLSVFPARVDKVNVSGISRTHDDYVQRTSDRLFNAKTFEDVLLECNEARNYLFDLGIYKDLRVHVDVSKGETASPNGYEITFDGVELSRLTGALGTEIGQNEGSLTVELATPNIFGRGERFSVQGSYSNCKTADVSLKLWKPYFHTSMSYYRPEVSLSFFRHSDTVQISEYKTQNFGLIGDFSFQRFPFNLPISHSFQYEVSCREIFTLGKTAPFFIREECGPRMASLFRYICKYDQRDNMAFPTSGIFIRSTNEFSGFGGNIAYMMNNTHCEINIPLFAGLTAQICSRLGVIQANKKSPDIPIGSLFTLGGPLSLRGFKLGGAGKHTDGAAAGAHSYWAAGFHIWAPLPFNSYFGRFGNNFRTHFFYNLGTCGTFDTHNIRSAAGVGIAFRLGERARIEFNYCVPIDKKPGDRVDHGLQFGIGYEFI